MDSRRAGGPPRWVFTVIMAGALIACGVYLGMMRTEGASTGNVVRVAGFALLGALMLWGVLARGR
ncbi:hypothetical protein ACFL2Z_04465 [Candidatus Eisenbacteria bacterium]|uniref:DUF1328 domain-containing protein n=1 Tax=Eiseniibacteriota bacterium TaxID=2212470 RepID=A0ABV6YPZ9_UNCEI